MHKDYLFSIFDLFKLYTFHEKPYTRLEIHGIRKGLTERYAFGTFTHPTFNNLWDLFIINNKKSIKSGLILNHLSKQGLTYWIMDDGSLQNDKKSLILHTQSYTKNEVEILSNELNIKFNFNSKVIPHKQKYFVIFIPKKDANTLYEIMLPYIHPSMNYKLPIINNSLY
jgi:LAGLIDADG DNA endonuclease family